MLLSVQLTNFRRHRDTRIDLTPGMNVLRGGNEHGKTTVSESIAYALYGTSVLRTSLDDAVTWGEKPGSLRAVLTLEQGGATYVFDRSKAGASVYTEGVADPLVTGQKQVSEFAAELLGADAKVAQSLLIAGQADLRGALDAGPSVISSLISSLAGLNQVEDLIAKAQEHLLLGSATPFDERLSEAREEYARAVLGMVPEEELDRVKTLMVEVEAEELALGKQVQEAGGDVASLKVAEVALSFRVRAERASLARRASLGHEAHDLDRQIEVAQKHIQRNPSAEAVAAAEEGFKVAKAGAVMVKAFSAVAQYGKTRPEGYEETLETLEARLDSALEHRRGLEDGLAEIEAEIRACWGKMIRGDGKCPTCGSMTHTPEQIESHNRKWTEHIDRLQVDREGAHDAIKKAQGVVIPLHSAIKAGQSAEVLIAKLVASGAPVSVLRDSTPPHILWSGDKPGEADISAAEAEVGRLKGLRTQADRAEGALQALQARLGEVLAERAALPDSSCPLLAGEVADLQDLQKTAQDRLDAASGRKAQARLRAQAGREAYTSLVQSDEQARRDATAARKRAAQIEQDLSDLSVNNQFLKKLRAIKPAATDKLWGQVLSSVGVYFSQIRGERSVVTKDSEGFKVNGKGVQGLSGSTLDALALAIRCALTRTFLPQTSLLILDEPAHGADSNRTANMLGFLASSGFSQVILCSHDEMSETVAQNVVTIAE